MKRVNLRILSLLLVLCTVLCACHNKPGKPETTDPSGEVQTYTVTVTDEVGNPLEAVGVFVYEDETEEELVWFARTDAEGKITFTHTVSTTCVAVLSELPEGCTAEAQYPITGPETTIAVSGCPVGEAAWKLGNNMPDFTFTDCEGNTYTLSELLQEKEAVVLNFWYIQCVPCKTEFPYLQEAYEQYSDRIALLAVNPVNDDNDAIAAYKAENGLTFPMGAVPAEWEQLMGITGYPTTVIIDRNGVISLIHRGEIPDTKTIADAMDYFASEDYVPGVIENIEDLVKEETVHAGTFDDPLEFPGMLNFELEVPAEGETYFVLTRLQSMYLQAKDPDVYIIYNGKHYPASFGAAATIVSAPDLFTPVVIGVGNPTKTDKTVKMSLSIPSGTVSNPYALKLEETTVKLYAGNDQGVYYKYTAKEDGELTVACLKIDPANVKYDIALLNTSNSAMRNLESDGTTDEDGNPCVTVKVKKGQSVLVTVMTLPDASRNYPAAAITIKATFNNGAGGEEEVELVNYAITVTDEDRKPIAGVTFQITTEDEALKISTDASGVARVQLPAGTYDAKLIIPAGFKSGATQFTLSEAIPMFAIKLDKDAVVTQTYTVKVQDEAGKPIPNVMVALGDAFAYTDANGNAVFTLPVGTYTAELSIPAGYDGTVTSFPFAKGETSLTVTLKEASTEPTEPLPGTIAYTVTVTDYNGAPCKTAVAQLYKDGKQAGMAQVNAQGVATLYAAADTYTVKLSFSGETLYYGETTVTEINPAATIRVAKALTAGQLTDLYFKPYPVTLGGAYVKMQADTYTYFIFQPETTGIYRFTTSTPNAEISYWGSNTSYIYNRTDSVDLVNNAFTLDISESKLMFPAILGVTGADNCILEISRIGDATPDEAEVPEEIYEAKTPPKPFTYKGGKTLVPVDLTAKTSDYTLVYNDTDKLYHVGSATGPAVYVNLGPSAPYVSMYDMLGLSGFGGTRLSRTFYDDAGKPIREVLYTSCMIEYVKCIDSKTEMYPLTEDLMIMLQNGGVGKGWWDKNNGNYLFGGLVDGSGNSTLNVDLAWMFACFVEQ